MQALPIPLALVDDHELFRSVMAEMLDTLPGYKVVLQAGHGRDLVRAMKQGVQVSVAVVDLHMPVMDGYATMQWIREHAPGTRSLALTYETSDEAMARALQAGACGFIRKGESKATFLGALDQVARTGRYVAPPDVEQTQALRAVQEKDRAVILAQLSERELAYIRLVCDEAEYTNEQIAEHMGVHRRTLDGYREHVHHKCAVKTKAGLAVFAYKWGLLDK